jgi:Fe2+ transport system protein FeoA
MDTGPSDRAILAAAGIRSLSELPLWTEGIVESVQGPADLRRRLLEMGFCNRAEVTPIRRAPLGDPLEFRLRGYYISLRKDEARWVLVSLRPEPSDQAPPAPLPD